MPNNPLQRTASAAAEPERYAVEDHAAITLEGEWPQILCVRPVYAGFSHNGESKRAYGLPGSRVLRRHGPVGVERVSPHAS